MPDVSVVMSVHNSASTLNQTIDSVLSQRNVSIEFVIINDGSTDDTDSILYDYEKSDDRLRVVRQENKGLTSSLILGCTLARGEYIARQDAGGDVSLPGRLAHQLAFLRARSDMAMTACGVRMIGPKNEVLCELRQQGCELNDALCSRTLKHLGGPAHHGAVMFRKSAYLICGGYRNAFTVAQDLDLWTRMAEIGACLATPDIFYEAKLTKGSISHVSRKEQMRAKRAIFACAQARAAGCDENKILESLQLTHFRNKNTIARRIEDSRYYYFIGSLLRKTAAQSANSYFLRALRCWPMHPRAWLGLLRSFHGGTSSTVKFESRPVRKRQ